MLARKEHHRTGREFGFVPNRRFGVGPGDRTVASLAAEPTSRVASQAKLTALRLCERVDPTDRAVRAGLAEDHPGVAPSSTHSGGQVDVTHL